VRKLTLNLLHFHHLQNNTQNLINFLDYKNSKTSPILFFVLEAMTYVLNEMEESKHKWDEYESNKKRTIAISLKR